MQKKTLLRDNYIARYLDRKVKKTVQICNGNVPSFIFLYFIYSCSYVRAVTRASCRSAAFTECGAFITWSIRDAKKLTIGKQLLYPFIKTFKREGVHREYVADHIERMVAVNYVPRFF